MAEKKVSVKVQDLTKTFKIPLEASSGIKQKIINLAKGRKGYREFTPLNDVSFEVNDGDFFGIVGRNGSGKSTLLKTIAGIYQPDAGAVTVNGKLVPFIELGVGFNPELSGKENVFLNGALLGFSRSEMQAMYDEIVDFAELHDFMEEKLKNYSSGMQVRLAFSIAIKVQGDVLLLDEVLAVGDEAFQRKCYDYFAQIRKEKRTVILVTHDMDSIQRYCNKAIMIEKGVIVEQGKPSVVAQRYRELFMPKSALQYKEPKKLKGDGFAQNDFITANVTIKQQTESLTVNLSIQPKIDLDEDSIVAFGIVRDSGEQVYRWASDEKMSNSPDFIKQEVEVTIDNIFPEGKYGILLVVKSRDRSKDYGTFDEILRFDVLPRTNHKWDTYWKPKETFKTINKKER
jgi:ABC-2 type transport system ATP-binding protein